MNNKEIIEVIEKIFVNTGSLKKEDLQKYLEVLNFLKENPDLLNFFKGIVLSAIKADIEVIGNIINDGINDFINLPKDNKGNILLTGQSLAERPHLRNWRIC